MAPRRTGAANEDSRGFTDDIFRRPFARAGPPQRRGRPRPPLPGGSMAATKLYKSLYLQVIVAIIIGVLLGHFYPHAGEAMKPLGDGFIKLIKMLIAPIIFCTVVHGIASMEDM